MSESSSYTRDGQTICRISLLVAVLLVVSCASQPSWREISLDHGLSWHPVHANGFTLHSISRPMPAKVEDLHIYIGGDGIPWQKSQPAINPTGTGRLALDLMLEDSTTAIYLTRPCYQLIEMPPECHSDLWTSARYSGLVVQTMADAITQLAATFKPSSLTLVGYSGGGVLALLAASRIDPQPRVITVASNLDTDAWTNFHGHLPLSHSSNPLLVMENGSDSRHIHLIGSRDTVVPPSTITRYKETHLLARYIEIENFDHRCCWVEHWNEILKIAATREPSTY